MNSETIDCVYSIDPMAGNIADGYALAVASAKTERIVRDG
jgi:hypothetical protein